MPQEKRQEGRASRRVAMIRARLRALVAVEWRPKAKADWGAGGAAGLALAVPLLAGTAVGHPDAGIALLLPVVLVAMPLPPGAGLRERARRLAVRAAWITTAGLYAYVTEEQPWALVPAVAVAAGVGALLPKAGYTPALAVLLIGISSHSGAFGFPGLPQLVGALWGGVLTLPRWGKSALADPVPAPGPSDIARRLRHAWRTGLVVGGAAAVMAALRGLTGEGHWLITGILLTLTPTPTGTRLKARQRIVGNTLGGVAAALVLLVDPGPWVGAAVVGVSGILAYGLRPANYLYWCLAFPLPLLLITDFGRLTPWYTAAVRAGMVLAGSIVAVLATHWLWPTTREPSRRTGPGN
ncbi:FUSC family protein [Nonomuraea longispora]|uniref:FUSC family protein n=1 Tax=Nonomuraea longispora TaxID=1848320 RepID=A0A4R4NGA8_9ACTN|nr:FUSC family protein [Nonomuraea longispora]TDC05842.1 FUSC family protein [Nonomuraea longispora]